jgi:hypothetical protein
MTKEQIRFGITLVQYLSMNMVDALLVMMSSIVVWGSIKAWYEEAKIWPSTFEVKTG